MRVSGSLQRELVSELLNVMYSPPASDLTIALVKVVTAKLLVGCSAMEQIVDNHPYRMGDRQDGTLGAPVGSAGPLFARTVLTCLHTMDAGAKQGAIVNFLARF